MSSSTSKLAALNEKKRQLAARRRRLLEQQAEAQATAEEASAQPSPSPAAPETPPPQAPEPDAPATVSLSPRSPVARTPPRGSPAPSSPTGDETDAQQELSRLETELALLEDDNRRLKQKLEGPEMEEQKRNLAHLREVLSQKHDEMSMLEQRQLEINELFRAVHDAKESLKGLAEQEAVLREEVRTLEGSVVEHDAASAAQVARAEEIAQALSTAGNHAELNRLENDLNKCIEKAESSSRELSTVKTQTATKLRDADAKSQALMRKSQETEAIEADAAARAKELPVIVAAMEATAHTLQDAEAELQSKTGAIDAVEAELRQRVQANSEAIKFTRNLKAVTEKKVAMENRNRSRMQVRVKPDQNLAAALESVRKGVTAKGQGGSLKERAKQASGAGPRARTPNASARSPFSGRVRTSGTADDRPRPAWRGSSATGAAADVRERQTSKLMVVRSRTPTRQSTAPGEAGDPAEGQPALAGEEADMEERSKDVERRRAREAGLSSKETQLERRETALRKASETLEREKAAIAAEKTALERERKVLARKQSAVEKLQKQVQAEREETRRTKEELGNLRSAAEEMEASFRVQNDEAVGQLQERVAKFKEAKVLQEQLLAEERQQLEAEAQALIAEKKAWKKQQKRLKAAA